MTDAQKDSAIKKINERYVQICREFGPRSGIANDYRNAMELAVGSENLQIVASTTSKKAPKNNPDYITDEIKIVQIKRSKKALEGIAEDDINALLNKHTAGGIKKTAREEAKRQSKEYGFNVSMRNVIEDMDDVYDFLEEYGYDSKDSITTKAVFDAYWDRVGRGGPRPTYTELKLLIKGLHNTEETVVNGQIMESKPVVIVDEKLHKRLTSKKRDLWGGL